jgi:hypothetical protein
VSAIRPIIILAAGLGTAFAPLAAMADWGVSMGAGMAHSDNVGRVADGQSATVATAIISGQVLSFGQSYDMDLESTVSFREYSDSAYDAEALPQLRGEVNWSPIPERFAWTFRDNFGQVALNPADSLVPADRQNANVFSTGPAMSIPLNRRWTLRVAGLYSDVYFEDDDFDNNRLTGRVTIERQISRRQSAFCDAFASRVDLKKASLGGYDLNGVFCGYAGEGARTSLSADVGIEALHDKNEVRRSLYADVYVNRRLSEHVNAALAYVSRYADSGDVFSLNQDLEPGLGNDSDTQVVSTPVSQRLASLGLDWEGNRSGAGLFLTWDTENAQSPLVPDREIVGLALHGSRRLSTTAVLGAMAEYRQESRTGAINEDLDDLALGIDLEIRLAEKISLTMQVERYTRRNSSLDYSENRAIVSVVYRPRALRADLPSFYQRHLNRRFVAARIVDPGDAGPGGN